MTKSELEILKTVPASKTLRNSGSGREIKTPELVIIWCHDPTMIGASVSPTFDSFGMSNISRAHPLFYVHDTQDFRALNDRHISRLPVQLRRIKHHSIEITPPDSQMFVRVNGDIIQKAAMFELDREIIITLSDKIILCLQNKKIVPKEDNSARLGMLGKSSQLAKVRTMIDRVAPTNMNVLIKGETGTGKELVAHAIHRESLRSDSPMVSVNMATLSRDLAQAELFGVKKGAFTGAVQSRPGLFEQADGGTLFLDEIGETAKQVQPMLLRAIETGFIRRVGDDQDRRVDVRLIAATDKFSGTISGNTVDDFPRFNTPLLQRLGGLAIDLPPLRYRFGDLGILLKLFLVEEIGKLPRKDIAELPTGLILDMLAYTWPGNIRELRNAAHRIRIGENGDLFKGATGRSHLQEHGRQIGNKSKYRTPSHVHDRELLDVLDANNWVIKDAAKSLGVSRPALYEIMSKCDKIRKINDISHGEIADVMKLYPDDLDAWTRHLRVGREALRRRIKTSSVNR